MPLVPVKSSSIAAVGYESGTKTLTVKFTSGATHHYLDVPRTHYDGLLGAKSAGGYFHKNIRSAFKSRPASN